MLAAQSFATGGWGPDETLRASGSTDLYNSLSNTHSGFETPCGSYAHFKLTRYLLRVTRDPRYGDSMERMMYNSILGAKPLEADGRTFYYSDLRTFKGRKVYSPHGWPCCSGTLPQVAADYPDQAHTSAMRGVYVVFTFPRRCDGHGGGGADRADAKSEYPYDSQVQFEVKASRAAEFAVSLRIPAWAAGASISVNGKRDAAQAGSFARVQRKWKTGDRIEVELPMTTRLEAVDPQHAETVALLVGPVVLFAITDAEPKVTRAQLLAAKKNGGQSWQVEDGGRDCDEDAAIYGDWGGAVFDVRARGLGERPQGLKPKPTLGRFRGPRRPALLRWRQQARLRYLGAGEFTGLMLPLTIPVISHSINNLKHDFDPASFDPEPGSRL